METILSAGGGRALLEIDTNGTVLALGARPARQDGLLTRAAPCSRILRPGLIKKLQLLLLARLILGMPRGAWGLSLILLAGACLAQELKIDAAKSTITIHVGKAGLFSAAGHEHDVTAPVEGTFSEAGTPRVAIDVDARKLTVQPNPKVNAKDQAEIQDSMQRKVLESDHYPRIAFRSTNAQKTGADAWKVAGTLTLHGVTRPVTVDVKKAGDVYAGGARIKQTDFGIQPVSVAGGVVKVKNELEIRFEIRAAGKP